MAKTPKAGDASPGTPAGPDGSGSHRHHLDSMLMRESLLDKDLQAKTETPVFRMLPDTHVMKIGGRSIIDAGREVLYPVVDALSAALERHRLILGTGGGSRARHVFSIASDLGLPTGVLAQLATADALGNAHILGTLLAPKGVVAIPPEIFGHLLPLFIRTAPGVIFNGVPPYSIWEHPPAIGRIPPHRTDAGSLLLAECFGSRTFTLVKNVDGLYDRDPAADSGASLIRETNLKEIRKMDLPTLPFDRIVLDILEHTRLIDRFQIVNGLEPENLGRALDGEHVGTMVYRD